MKQTELEAYENFLRKDEKHGGRELFDSTIEKYGYYIKSYLPALSTYKNPLDMIPFMNEEIKKRPGMLFSAFRNYLRMKGCVKKEILEQLTFVGSRQSAIKSKRFLQSKVLSRGEVRRLIDEVKDLQMKTAIAVLYDSGARRHELMSSKWIDIEWLKPDENPKDKAAYDKGIRARYHIVLGKEGKSRVVHLRKTSVKLLGELYKQRKKEEYSVSKEDKIFKLYKDKTHKILYKFQDDTFYKKFKGLSNRILGRKLHPHCLRHTCLSHMADQGADILGIKVYAGHEDIKTTQIYIDISTFAGQRTHMDFSSDPLEG